MGKMCQDTWSSLPGCNKKKKRLKKKQSIIPADYMAGDIFVTFSERIGYV